MIPTTVTANARWSKPERWFWEDEERGARMTGARSASWDTGFALQALSTAPQVSGVPDALRRGADYLRQQQIETSFPGFREAYRNDPQGGWCFAERWHGWPVTDCTAEAALGIIAADGAAAPPEALREAVRFMLRGQNRDGGFGSYESMRPAIDLERINPAEMFGESMTEHSYVECTASCLAAFAACREHSPEVIDKAVERAMAQADAWLRRTQASDGSWRGVWGVQYIYGTFFGIRGLIAGGARPTDPALRKACQWLLDRQQEDGGWGEHHSGCLTGQYVAHEQRQVIPDRLGVDCPARGRGYKLERNCSGRRLPDRLANRRRRMAQAGHGRSLLPHCTARLRPLPAVLPYARARALRGAAQGLQSVIPLLSNLSDRPRRMNQSSVPRGLTA